MGARWHWWGRAVPSPRDGLGSSTHTHTHTGAGITRAGWQLHSREQSHELHLLRWGPHLWSPQQAEVWGCGAWRTVRGAASPRLAAPPAGVRRAGWVSGVHLGGSWPAGAPLIWARLPQPAQLDSTYPYASISLQPALSIPWCPEWKHCVSVFRGAGEGLTPGCTVRLIEGSRCLNLQPAIAVFPITVVISDASL